MKKLLFLLCTMFLFAVNAQAAPFTLDLTTIGGSYGTYEDIFRINVDGFASVDQSFGADGIFNSGDTFKEMTLLQEITYKQSLSGTNLPFADLAAAGKMLYIYAEELTGVAQDVVFGTPGVLASAEFTYLFDTGAPVGMYIDDIASTLSHNAFTAQLVGSFSLYAGDGAGSDGFLGGLDNAGTSRLSGQFLADTPDGVWLMDPLDLGALPTNYSAFAELNTTNQVIGGVSLYDVIVDAGGNVISVGGFTADVNSTGHFAVNVVPEPSTFLLLGGGLLGLGFMARRKKKA